MKKFRLLLLASLVTTLGCLGAGSRVEGPAPATTDSITAPSLAPGDPAPAGAFAGAGSSPDVFAPTGDAPRIEEYGVSGEFRVHYQDGIDLYLTASAKHWLTITEAGRLPLKIWVEWKDWNDPNIWHTTVDGNLLRFVFKPAGLPEAPRTACDFVLENTGGRIGTALDLLFLPPYGPDLIVTEGDLEIYLFPNLSKPDGTFVVPGPSQACSTGLAPFGTEELYQTFKTHPAAKYIGTFGLTLPAIL